MVQQPFVFNIEQVDCLVDGEPVVDVSGDGFGISPISELTRIEGLKGDLGFNVDPSTAAEGSVSLKSISPSLKRLIGLWKNRTIFKFSVKAKQGFETSLGFKEMFIQYAVMQKSPEFKTDGKEAPAMVFPVIGYGFDIVPLD